MRLAHGLTAVIAVLAFGACELPEEDAGTAADRADVNTKSEEPKPDKSEKAEPEKPSETKGQEQARKKAADYLDLSAFSRSGLIEQLEFEGFSKKDAIYGTDAQKANWKKQAAAKAEAYLDLSSFSRQGLIEQLEFEGFTRAQAEYGADKLGF